MLNEKSMLSQDVDFYSAYDYEEEHKEKSSKEALVKGIFQFIVLGLFLLLLFFLYPYVSKINFKNLLSFESTTQEVFIDKEHATVEKNQPLVKVNTHSKEEIQKIVASVVSELTHKKEIKEEREQIAPQKRVAVQQNSNKEIDDLMKQILNELK